MADLDQVIADVLGLERRQDPDEEQPYYCGNLVDFDGSLTWHEWFPDTGPLHCDWNALMAAVAKLEEKGYRVDRNGMDSWWRVEGNKLVAAFHWGNEPWQYETENAALARCIAAVWGQKPPYAGQDSPPVQDGGVLLDDGTTK